MTKPYSQLSDNDGRCERCDQPAPRQLAVPILLAGMGPGGMPTRGTMWMCYPCIEASGRKPPDYMPPDAKSPRTERTMTKLLAPLEGAFDPDCPHVTVPCARCPMHIFVAKSDPRLPGGPFFCPDHSDAPSTFKTPDSCEAIIICDHCGAQLTARAASREAAIALLDVEIIEKCWHKATAMHREDLCAGCQR